MADKPTLHYLVNFDRLPYNGHLLLNAKDLASLTEIVSRTYLVVTPYGGDSELSPGLGEAGLAIKSIQTSLVEELKQACFLGITHSQYLEGINATKQGTTGSKEPV